LLIQKQGLTTGGLITLWSDATCHDTCLGNMPLTIGATKNFYFESGRFKEVTIIKFPFYCCRISLGPRYNEIKLQNGGLFFALPYHVYCTRPILLKTRQSLYRLYLRSRESYPFSQWIRHQWPYVKVYALDHPDYWSLSNQNRSHYSRKV